MTKVPSIPGRIRHHVNRFHDAARSFSLPSLTFSLWCALIVGVGVGVAYASTGAPYALMPRVITSPLTAGVSIGLGAAVGTLFLALALSSPIAARRLHRTESQARQREIARSIRRYLSHSDDMEMQVLLHQQGPYGAAMAKRWSGVEDVMAHAARLLHEEGTSPEDADAEFSTSRESVNAILAEQYESLWRVERILSAQPGWLNFWQAECAPFTRTAQHTTSHEIRDLCDCTALTDALLAGDIDPADALAALDDKARTLASRKRSRGVALLRGLINLDTAHETMTAQSWEQMWKFASRATPAPVSTVSLVDGYSSAVHRTISEGILHVSVWFAIPFFIVAWWVQEMAHRRTATVLALNGVGLVVTGLVAAAFSRLTIVYSASASVPLAPTVVMVMVVVPVVATGVFGIILAWLRRND
ncbi:hypothetical protein [Actinomyces vulturis]|uniref:hypothetical protein n=1 Tax=Actinomyces vulturis TaxID=1857645 RepID=UPI00082A52CE|nr:hypothetical protein [Actinomyces vulturis]